MSVHTKDYFFFSHTPDQTQKEKQLYEQESTQGKQQIFNSIPSSTVSRLHFSRCCETSNHTYNTKDQTFTNFVTNYSYSSNSFKHETKNF